MIVGIGFEPCILILIRPSQLIKYYLHEFVMGSDWQDKATHIAYVRWLIIWALRRQDSEWLPRDSVVTLLELALVVDPAETWKLLTKLLPVRYYWRRNELNLYAVLDDKKLTAALKKLNLQAVNGIDEVNIFKENDEVIHITQPKCTFNWMNRLHPCYIHHLFFHSASCHCRQHLRRQW